MSYTSGAPRRNVFTPTRLDLNPILAAFRKDAWLYKTTAEAAAAWVDHPSVFEYVARREGGTMGHERHAERVVRLLAAV